MMNSLLELGQPNLKEKANILMNKSPLFAKVLNDLCDTTPLQPQERTELEEILKAEYPNEVLDDFIVKWKKTQTPLLNDRELEDDAEDRNLCHNNMFFDPTRRKYLNYKMTVTQPLKNNQKEFDVYDFITRKENEGDIYPIDMESSCEDALLDVSYEQRKIDNNLADQALRKIVRIVADLNKVCKFRVLDYAAEKRIN